MNMPLLAVLAVLVVVVVVVTYNRFVALRTVVAESWRQVDVELQRRADLIPNLVETVQGYAAHESQTLALVAAARSADQAAAHAAASRDAGPAARQPLEATVSRAVGAVLAQVEAYPTLAASASFTALQEELTNTEDRIAAARRFYNANVRALNTKVATVPSNLVAAVCGFGPAEFFELEDPADRDTPGMSL